MKIYTTYKVKIKGYNHIFKDTIFIYREAVDDLLTVCYDNWDKISQLNGNRKLSLVEHLVHRTKDNPHPAYDFDSKFYKLPSYLRRGAINEAIGKIASYTSNLDNWKKECKGKKPSFLKAGYVYPCMYRSVMFRTVDKYTAQVKVYIRNTWDWITIRLRRSDMDYIYKHCNDRKMCAPTFQKRGKEWFLDFPFEEETNLTNKNVFEQTIVAVDLGINTAATISVIRSDGTIIGRHFCKLPKEIDRLTHSINRIKKAQQYGNSKMPRLWARAKGINHDIACKTANYIMDISTMCKGYEKRRKQYLEGKRRVSEYDSENIMYTVIEQVLQMEQFSEFDVVTHQPLNAIISDPYKLNDKETLFAMNPMSHVDFLIYNKIDKSPVLAVEVDGYTYHDKNARQQERDKIKDTVFEKYNIPLIRFNTTGSGEKEKLINKLSEILGNA